MYKKIMKYSIIVGLSTVCNITFSMEQDFNSKNQQLMDQKYSVLEINDYIVPVPTAYHALKRELFLMYDAMKRMSFEKINEKIRATNQIPIVCRISADKAYLEKTRSLYSPTFMYIKIPYQRLEDDEAAQAYVCIEPYIYTILDRAKFNPIPYKRDNNVKKIDLKKHKKGEGAWQWLALMIQYAMQKIEKQGFQKPYCIELHSDRRVSDWIVVQREKTPREREERELFEDNSVFRNQDLKYDKVDQLKTRNKICFLIPSVVVLIAAVYAGLSYY